MKRIAGATVLLYCVLIILCAASAAAHDYSYALIKLQMLHPDDPGSVTYALNSGGIVSGASYLDSRIRAVLWDGDGRPIHLGTLGGNHSEARDVNDLDEAVGWSNFDPENSIWEGHAFLWRSGNLIDLGTLGGRLSEAYAINDLGQVVGWAGYDLTGSAAFVWENGQMHELPSHIRRSGIAYDINNSGQIVGQVVGEVSLETAALWENEQLIVLPPLSDRRAAVAPAINDHGHVVGQADFGTKVHAVAWVDGQVFDLHQPSLGEGSSAWGINDLNHVVGWVGRRPNSQAFIWTVDQGMRTLDSLVPSRLRTPTRLNMAHDINDAGHIAAYGLEQGDPFTLIAYLVNPVTPTMNLAAPNPGRAGEANTITVTNCTPGATVQFLYSRFGGGQRIPGCDLQQNALQLDSPTVIGTAIADGNGVATITRTVPPIARNQTILFQAVVQNECAISQLVVHRFE